MSIYAGYNGAVAIGTTLIAELNEYELPGMKRDILEASRFRDTWKRFKYGQIDGGSPWFSGFFDASDPTGMDLINEAYQNGTSLTTLRFYYGINAREFFHLTPGGSCLVEDISIGKADLSGLIPVKFNLKISNGFFDAIAGYYYGTDVSFTHATGANNDTVNKTSGTSFVGLGFLAGQQIVIEGSESNDLALDVYNVAANVLTLSSDTLTTETAGDNVSVMAFTEN